MIKSWPPELFWSAWMHCNHVKQCCKQCGKHAALPGLTVLHQHKSGWEGEIRCKCFCFFFLSCIVHWMLMYWIYKTYWLCSILSLTITWAASWKRWVAQKVAAYPTCPLLLSLLSLYKRNGKLERNLLLLLVVPPLQHITMKPSRQVPSGPLDPSTSWY